MPAFNFSRVLSALVILCSVSLTHEASTSGKLIRQIGIRAE